MIVKFDFLLKLGAEFTPRIRIGAEVLKCYCDNIF